MPATRKSFPYGRELENQGRVRDDRCAGRALPLFGLAKFSFSSFRLASVPVAQPDRASDFGSEGWGFESLQARHLLPTSYAEFFTIKENSVCHLLATCWAKGRRPRSPRSCPLKAVPILRGPAKPKITRLLPTEPGAPDPRKRCILGSAPYANSPRRFAFGHRPSRARGRGRVCWSMAIVAG